MTRFRSPLRLLIALALASAGAGALAQGGPVPTRGQLLYEVHCVACHDTQVHWRQNKKATDWNSLLAQVRRWQASERLGWSEADITLVGRHLNDTIYRFPVLVGRSRQP